jgi:hypothetical protein|tara:strand:+ start:1733 stop:2074 length:342 start_codon:yes stop_codon:yes gene_type:complete
VTPPSSVTKAAAFFIIGTNSGVWHKKREKKGIRVKLLWSQKLRYRKVYLKDKKFIEIKFLESDSITPTSTGIYADKVFTIVWSDRPILTLIKSKAIAESYRNRFNLLWKQAKK